MIGKLKVKDGIPGVIDENNSFLSNNLLRTK